MKKLLTIFFILATTVAVAQTPQKKILMEKISSAGCGGCGYGDYIIDSLMQLNSNVIPVVIHWHNATHIDSLTSPDGDSILADYLAISPSAMFDRKKYSDLNWIATSFLDDWQYRIDERSLDPVAVNVDGVTSYNPATRELTVDVSGEFLITTAGDIRVNAYITENHLVGSGPGWDQDNSFHTWPGHPMEGMGHPMTNYHHNHVVRKMMGGHFGAAGIIPNPVNPNDTFAHTFQYTLDPEWNDNEIEVVVMVQMYHADSSRREILNARLLPVTGSPVSIDEVEAAQFNIYPNPGTGIFQVQIENNGEPVLAEVFDLTGRKVTTQMCSGNATTPLDLSKNEKGIYTIRLLINSKVVVRKIILQ
jgi:hypothetical protein